MFENLTERFDNLEIDKDYWFIRTSKGKNFEAFTTGGFIGIGWNYITAQDLRDRTEAEIRTKIALNERNNRGELYDSASTKGKSKITQIYNKIRKFEALKEGDLVVIPSRNSEYLSFGFISDTEIYNDFADLDCDFFKRRRISWIITKGLFELDPIFYKIIFSMHAISSLNGYASYIDKVVSHIFVKGDRSHLVMDIRKQEDINMDALMGLMASMKDLTSEINTEFQLGEDLSNSSVKLNVQSPGAIEFIYNHGRTILIASILLATPIVVSCSHGQHATTATQEQKTNERDGNLQNISDTIDRVDAITQPEKDSLKKFSVIHYDTIAKSKQRMDELQAHVDTQNLIN
jgi:restriction system protein